jgi:hypothetical protein
MCLSNGQTRENGGQFVNALLFVSDYPKLTHRAGSYLIDTKIPPSV